jgi:hypothetical protein
MNVKSVMKQFQSTSIAGFALALTASASQAQSTFPDVPDNHWAAAAVKRLAEAGIVEGKPARIAAPARQAQTIEKSQTTTRRPAPRLPAGAKSRSVRPQKGAAR